MSLRSNYVNSYSLTQSLLPSLPNRTANPNSQTILLLAITPQRKRGRTHPPIPSPPQRLAHDAFALNSHETDYYSILCSHTAFAITLDLILSIYSSITYAPFLSCDPYAASLIPLAGMKRFSRQRAVPIADFAFRCRPGFVYRCIWGTWGVRWGIQPRLLARQECFSGAVVKG